MDGTDAKIVKTLSTEEMDKIVLSVFPSIKEYKAELLKGGFFNTSYLLSISENDGDDLKKYVLRVGPVNRELLLPHEQYLMEAETWAYEKMNEKGIPASHVVKLDSSKSIIDRDFMVVKYIKSRGMHTVDWSGDDKKLLHREIGRYTKMMSEITGKKFGRVGYIIHGGGYDTWSEYIKAELVEIGESTLKNEPEYYSEEEIRRICSIADRYKELLDEVKTPCFNHCDLWAPNVLVPENGEAKILAIIDPDRVTMGDPDLQLSICGMADESFCEGYGRRLADDENTRIRSTIYRLVFTMVDGYFMWNEYDDKSSAAEYKKHIMNYLEILENNSKNIH